MKKIPRLNRRIRPFKFVIGLASIVLVSIICVNCRNWIYEPSQIIRKSGISKGICVLLEDTGCKQAVKLAQDSELLIYVQLSSPENIESSRRAVDEAGFYGSRIFIEKGDMTRIHLADNIADLLIAVGEGPDINESEALRILRPGGKGYIGKRVLTKPEPDGIDEWSHPYHGPDNNPQSTDQVARAPYLTQFLAEPYYAPLTQVAVASGGRVFQAYGNIAFHEREESLLNSLVAYNAYNGSMLWKRRLTPGFMIHRNTMIATPEILFVGDDKSCKVIDAATGLLKKEILPPPDVAGGTCWKWMALENGMLYALIGEQEQMDPVIRQKREEHGWPWDPISKGFNQPENPWGFGRNLLAINPKSGKVIWSHSEKETIDSRALCMKNGRIYIYHHGKFLACMNAATGNEVWRRTPENYPKLFDALGTDLDRQDWRTNWRTTAYLKCSDEALYFAGPTVGKLLAVSAKDGSVLWEDPYNNFQLVLRDDGLYGISGQIDMHKSKKFHPITGEVLAEIDTKRRACTRPNGSVDAILYRAEGGSIRLDLATLTPQWISPMRPQCHNGVTIANGLLYWWPSVCDCQATLYGITCLGPAGDFNFNRKATEEERLEQYASPEVSGINETPADWPTFRANNSGNATTEVMIPGRIQRLWWFNPGTSYTPTAPVSAGDLLFFSGSDGIVRAVNSETGVLEWKAYTGGPVRFPPTFWEGRLLVGSGDGWVYSFEASTGRLLWRFRAAPEHRKIPVYGSLMSTWPVASGVIVEKGIAYFASGIINYDGTYVYALNAATGKIKWQNNTSGHLDPDSRTGVSVQGHMLIDEGKLYLASGTTISPAVFDLEDGKCLNDPSPLKLLGSFAPRGWELYKIGDKIAAGGQPLYGDPKYPVYDPSVTEKMLYTSANGRDILLLNNKRIVCFNKIPDQILNNSLNEPDQLPVHMIRTWGKLNTKDDPLWEYDCGEAFAMVRCANAVILSANRQAEIIEVLDIKNGKRLWSQQLASSPLPWGLIVDHAGRIFVTLKDGQIMCYGQRKGEHEL